MLQSFIWGSLLAVFLLSAAYAQDSEPKASAPGITVHAEAVVTVEPDQAEIDIGVVTQSRTAVEAANENASKLARVIAELKKIVAGAGEIKTAGYSLAPSYRYPKEGGRPEIVGYTAINVVRAKVWNLTEVGKLIDATMRAGANRVQRLVFTLKDEQVTQRQALRAATAKARAKADEIARALGVKIARVQSVTEGGREVRPLMHEPVALQAEAMAAETPIEAGTLEVRASVTLTAEIAR